MGDLTELHTFTCKQNTEFKTAVIGSKNDEYEVSLSKVNEGEYQYNWHCSCKGFQYRGKCKHIVAADKEKCHWGEGAFAGEMREPEVTDSGEKICPECKGPVEPVVVMV